MNDILEAPATIALIAIAGAAVLAVTLHRIAFAVLRRIAHVTEGKGPAAAIVRRTDGPTLVLAVAIAVDIALVAGPLSRDDIRAPRHAVALVIIAAVAWLVVRLARVAGDLLLERFDVQVSDNRVARKVHTQAIVFQRVVAVLATIVAAAAMLTTFPQARVMGTSILASAGIAGLVLGLAAQSTLSNLLAGLQIALTDSVRIDDVVIVEGEWGRVEEITFTYIVVRIWDERRLVLPISYMTTTPFQNWTRTSAQILGTVFLKVDYTVPVDALRKELDAIVNNSTRWDGRVSQIVVTDVTDRAIELRVLVSAKDSGTAWDLRCEVREKLVGYIHKHYPETLPRTRAEVQGRDGWSIDSFREAVPEAAS